MQIDGVCVIVCICAHTSLCMYKCVCVEIKSNMFPYMCVFVHQYGLKFGADDTSASQTFSGATSRCSHGSQTVKCETNVGIITERGYKEWETSKQAHGANQKKTGIITAQWKMCRSYIYIYQVSSQRCYPGVSVLAGLNSDPGCEH